MSLVRLLTSGKALTVLRDLPSAYRMRREALLPKFGSGANPFTSDDQVSHTGAAVVTREAVADERSPRKTIWPWKKAPVQRNGGAMAETGHARKSPVRDVRLPVQAELSLDQVKVMRNDLHGSDVDLVSRSIGTEKSYQQVAANLMSRANAAEQALDRLAARIVGAGAR